ncbi:T9SS type A sorting domain-containing protein [Flavobacterium rakeshii]|uniref:T9SS type A sorting domain-containing protein n=1 Tax=Flavobacterium rakeshii TaxID=1038845 RepID=A0A6N8HGE2_9FLAO|nr:T9SS type A sorting domain-containing protein [Flavobacterium rakeshii]MEE1897592.1 T9SS type A sorting domain-containing protein [Flavobacterium rakeshii]MUV04817.1 T9SS type A sorting domain-containing protein [Flavobacterium rakeshii]
MKKLLLLAGLLCLGSLNAQITVTHDGVPFENEEVFTYNTPGSELKILVTNTSQTETTYVKIRVDEVLNTTLGNNTGNNVQFCILGICYTGVTAGVSYPPNDIVVLAPNTSTEEADHFYSSDPGNGEGPTQYSFTVLETDANGDPLNELVSFTYIYSPTAGVNDFETLKNMGITVNNTVTNNSLNIDATVNATLQVYDINGKVVKTASIENGFQTIDLSSLNSAVYIAKFMTEDKKSTQIKIVKN